jgi:hypothetical protein
MYMIAKGVFMGREEFPFSQKNNINGCVLAL